MLRMPQMSEFRIVENYEGNSVLLENLSTHNYYILCDSAHHAQQLKLAILLETLPSPIVAPELYMAKANKNDSTKIFIPKDIALFNENSCEEDDESLGCCQSGCSGCPYYKGGRN